MAERDPSNDEVTQACDRFVKFMESGKPQTDTESVLWHTPSLQEVVEMLYPEYKNCKALYQALCINSEHPTKAKVPDEVQARNGYVFVVMEAPGGIKFLLEIHENCFRADGPPMHPENMVTPAEAEREIASETYTVLPSGRAIVCQLTLVREGHTEEGIAHVIDGENFNLKKGREAARRKAMDGVFRYLAQRKREFVGKRHTQD